MKTRSRLIGRSQRTEPYRNNTTNTSTKRLYIGNLNFDIAWQELKDFCKQAGKVVRADVEIDEQTGRSKGYGIVEYATTSDAEYAIQELNGKELNGRIVNVREDRENKITNTNNLEKKSKLISGRRLYVGNLAYEVSWQDLKDHFKQVGNVLHADVLKDSDSGRSKGCGLVEFSNQNEARRAVSELHDSELCGRLIFVREDREEASGSGSRNKETRSQTSHAVNNSIVGNSLYVGNLSFDCSWQDLKDHFRQSGNVVRANVAEDENGRSKGYGLVEFASPQDAIRAMRQLNDTEVHGRPIFVREDREKGSSTNTQRTSDSFKNNNTKNVKVSLDQGLPSSRSDTMSIAATEDNIDSGTGSSGNSSKIYVGNLSFDTTWQILKDHFRTANAGEIVHADIPTNSNSKSKGYGIVEYVDPVSAQSAIARLHDSILDGRKLNVREYRNN